MSQNSSAVKENINVGINEPSEYDVIFHNDDFTPMDFVVNVLVYIFLKDVEEAYNLMMEVHCEGKACVGTYSFDIAVSRKNKTVSCARTEGFPLRVTVEKR